MFSFWWWLVINDLFTFMSEFAKDNIMDYVFNFSVVHVSVFPQSCVPYDSAYMLMPRFNCVISISTAALLLLHVHYIMS